MPIQISPYLKDTTLGFTARTLIYQLLMAIGFYGTRASVTVRTAPVICGGEHAVSRHPKTALFGGKKHFRGSWQKEEKEKRKRGKKCLSDAKSCCTRATCALGIKNTVRGRRRGAEASPASAAFGRAWSLFKLLGSKRSQRGFIIIIFLLLFFHYFIFFPCANDSLCGVGRRREKGSWGEPSRPLLPSAAGRGMLPPKGG